MKIIPVANKKEADKYSAPYFEPYHKIGTWIIVQIIDKIFCLLC